jgi:predicted DCC family thiol-disulfide oxidoreductase YuxK
VGNKPKIEVYYDGTCPMCTAFVGAVEESAQGEKFAKEDVTKGNLPTGATFDDVWKEMYVVEDGVQYRGADAVLRIMREYPVWRPLAWIGSLPGFNWCAHCIYRVVAANRHRIPWKRRVK